MWHVKYGIERLRFKKWGNMIWLLILTCTIARGNQTKKRIVLNVHCTISNAKEVLHENIQKIPCSHKSVLINLITR